MYAKVTLIEEKKAKQNARQARKKRVASIHRRRNVKASRSERRSMPDTNDILARLRTRGPDSPIGKLAAVAVDDVFARTVGDLVDQGALVDHIGAALASFVESDAAAAHAVTRVDAVFADLEGEQRPLRARVPAALPKGATAFARLPTTPSREALMKLLDREPLKALLRAQVVDALAAFGRRAASPVADSSIARGLGGISKLALGSSGRNPFARVATAVSGEVERQVEKRATDFADTAVVGILSGIADQVTDPSRREDQAALRTAIVDGFFELTGADVAGLARGDAAAQVAVVRSALRAWLADAKFAADLRGALSAAIARDTARTLGEVLDDVALRDPVRAAACVWLTRTLEGLVADAPFAAWLADLLA
jgi:hypothetical protein